MHEALVRPSLRIQDLEQGSRIVDGHLHSCQQRSACTWHTRPSQDLKQTDLWHGTIKRIRVARKGVLDGFICQDLDKLMLL